MLVNNPHRFTGVAYGCAKPDKSVIAPEAITLWSTSCGNLDCDSPKIPSQIEYTRNGDIVWGQQASNGGLLWFKLLLLDELDLQLHLRNSDHLKQARDNLDKTGKDIVTVVSDYLRKVWNHVMKTIARAQGQQWLDNRPLHVVVTVPAIWQDDAIQRMRCALAKVGILNKRPGCRDTTHEFISEPEAAVLAAFDKYEKIPGLTPGQTFVIADLGGGTVVSAVFLVTFTYYRYFLH